MTTLPVIKVPVVRIKLRAALEERQELTSIYSWLEKWKPTMSLCSRTGGVWDDRYEVIVPERALNDLPNGVIYCQLPESRQH